MMMAQPRNCTDDLVRLDNLAFDLCARSLRAYGNELSDAHEDMLLKVVITFGLIASGNVPGRYVWTAPAGLGKTRLMICWIKAMVALGFPWSVAVCSERVEELIAIWRDLHEGECPVPESEIGLWHAKVDAEVPPTFTPEEARAGAYRTRRILLLTHARLQQSEGEAAKWLRYYDQPRSIVFYDESLLQTSYWSAPYVSVVAELEQAAVTAGLDSRAGQALEEVKGAINQEQLAQKAGPAPTLMRLPEEITRSGPVRKEIEEIVQRDRLGYLRELLFHNNREGNLRLICARNPRNSLLIRPYATVPTEELDRMIVLDASWPVRTLLTLANRNMAKDAKAKRLQIKPIEEVWPDIFRATASIKRYDHVTIHLMTTTRSGRSFSIQDAETDADFGGGAIVREIVELVASLPEDDPVLIWTFLPHEEDTTKVVIDFPSNLRDALVEHLGAGVLSSRGDGQPPRVTIETFGREQASNAHKHAKHVIFQGCLELPPEHLAAQYVAETRDILAPVSLGEAGEPGVASVTELNKGEVAHRVYQALHRGRCREAWLDDQRQTQAREMHVWLFNRFHKYLREELSRVMPGVKFETWEPKYMDEEFLSKEARGARIIKGILANLTQDKISLRALKQKAPFLRKMATKTFQRARNMALGDEETGWTMKGGSLVRCS